MNEEYESFLISKDICIYCLKELLGDYMRFLNERGIDIRTKNNKMVDITQCIYQKIIEANQFETYHQLEECEKLMIDAKEALASEMIFDD